MPLAIEIFELRTQPGTIRIDINGAPWTTAACSELGDKLAEIGAAYSTGNLAKLLRKSTA